MCLCVCLCWRVLKPDHLGRCARKEREGGEGGSMGGRQTGKEKGRENQKESEKKKEGVCVGGLMCWSVCALQLRRCLIILDGMLAKREGGGGQREKERERERGKEREKERESARESFCVGVFVLVCCDCVTA